MLLYCPHPYPYDFGHASELVYPSHRDFQAPADFIPRALLSVVRPLAGLVDHFLAAFACLSRPDHTPEHVALCRLQTLQLALGWRPSFTAISEAAAYTRPVQVHPCREVDPVVPQIVEMPLDRYGECAIPIRRLISRSDVPAES